jgi:hypothetical protein
MSTNPTRYPQLPHCFTLSELEEGDAANWLNKPKVQALLKKGGSFAVVFGPSNGIGMPVTVTVKSEDGEILSEDVTDVSTW